MGNYVIAADLDAYKVNGSVIDLTGLNNDDKNAAIALAEAIVESVTDNIFYEQTTTRVFDGSGRDCLYLPPTCPYPIVALTSVTEVDVDGSTVLHTWTEGKDFKVYSHHLELIRSTTFGRARLAVINGGVWPQGQRNIKIAGTWGSAAVPVEITEAVKLLALERLKPGSTQMSPRDIKQHAWPDLSVTFRGGDGAGKDTGFLEVDRLLLPHVNRARLLIGSAVPNGPSLFGGMFQ